ncbi:cytidylyltransferase domain-containing protein [Virgibacillus ihumii]|uniref:cytidylyltransferase domain-containing protein n=1 Tax=Virgibacillus ihumii TaxID=2686091 RepID=UPI00157DE88A|nr:glycosyltransferase family protein [Virgibacillus ihumii]
MNIVAIIQARMGSTRLPEKIMKKVSGKPLLEYQIERVKRSKLINKIIIATTVKQQEQPIIDLCDRLSVDYYRGSENDVLSRFYEAATESDADAIVRLTADCPLISPHVIDNIISQFLLLTPKYDYVSNTIERTYPLGLDTEVFSMECLETASREGKKDLHREHVTAYMYTHPNKFITANVKHTQDHSNFRLTVDTKEDFQLIANILETLYPQKPDFELEDIIRLLEKRKDWLAINAHVEQKKFKG